MISEDQILRYLQSNFPIISTGDSLVGLYDCNRKDILEGYMLSHKFINLYNKNIYIQNSNDLGDITHISKDKIEKVQIETDEPPLVDLGLPSGNLWMKCNIGAKLNTDFGRYFQLGDIIGYTGEEALNHSIEKTSPFCGGNVRNKHVGHNYFSDVRNIVTDERGVLKPNYDAVTVRYGNAYRMPTREDLEELKDSTNSFWSTINVDGTKVPGRTFKSKINGEEIFFPSGGYYTPMEGPVNLLENSIVWSSSIVVTKPFSAYIMFMSSTSNTIIDDYLFRGIPIRGIKVK